MPPVSNVLLSTPNPLFAGSLDANPRLLTRQDLLEGQLAPELARYSAMLLDAGTLAVELVVLGSCKLLGRLRAVVAAAGAERGAGGRHARCYAGDGALGKHFCVGRVEIGAIGCVRGRWVAVVNGVRCDGKLELTKQSLAVCQAMSRCGASRRAAVFALFDRTCDVVLPAIPIGRVWRVALLRNALNQRCRREEAMRFHARHRLPHT